ncbi:MAG TPA: hypothetical protein DCY13_09430 [Verrucomicrobiales bacterium]|nr:hypothetical protein [Verrucomicrobiales bacterium]
MKPKIALLFQTGAGIGLVALVLALNPLRAASDAQKPAKPVDGASAGVSAAPPPAPEAPPEAEPPAIPALVPPPIEMSAGMEEVFKLARSGVSEEVLNAFIEKSGRAYQPTAEEIIYLKDLGVPPNTIATLIRTGNRESALASQVEAGEFAGVEAEVKQSLSSTRVEAKDGTTINVTTENHFAAAPQPLNATPAAETPSQAQAEAQLDINYFRTSLSPYGSWVYVEGIGDCWRPTVAVVNSDWRPYYDGGRWIYTNSGWYWLSDYSWGWGPFHYGRWHRHANWGWVWMPGYTWGPAWVEWRTTSTYCGWAPLPPYYGAGFSVSHWGGSFGFSISWGHYNWIPYRYCNGYYPRRYSVHHHHSREVYQNSTVVRPTIIGNNNTVIITGPDSTVVAQNSGRTEIKRVTLRDSSVGTRAPVSGPRDYIENGGSTLATFRPPTRGGGGDAAASGLAVRTESPRSTSGAQSAGTPTVASTSPTAGNAVIGQDGSIYLRGNGRDSGEATSGRTESSRPTASSEASGNSGNPRLAGQHTTINPNPTYRRPAAKPTQILRDPGTLTITRQPSISPPVVSGGIRTEAPRSVPSVTEAPGASFGRPTAPRQTIRPSVQSESLPKVADAPTYTPPRRFEISPPSTSSRTESFRSSPQIIRRSESAPRFTPSERSPRINSAPSSPVIAPPSRPSFSTPSPAPNVSAPPARSFAPAPARSAEPSRGVSSPPASAPSRAPVAPPPSSGRSSGGGGRGPTRQQN